ncbi:MAG: hypothetical protein M3Y60_05840, partial [Bacteroidota bacterium]|nr:hypothetical protein [Bacteroidota bacterium]
LLATALPGHTYFWYNNSDAPDENFVIANFDDNTSGNNYLNLVPGDYTLVVRSDATQCKSQPVISTIANMAPGISPVAFNLVIPTDCNALGEIGGGVHLTASPNAFTSDDATDRLTTTAPLGLSVNSMVVITRTGLPPLPLPLIANKIYYIETIAGNDITLSETPGGPRVNINANGVGSIGDVNTAGYSFEWYAGVPSPTDPGLGSIDYFHNPPVYTGPILSSGSTLLNVASGLYTMQVTNTATGCKIYLPHTLPYQDSHAVLRITKTNSTICPFTVGNGSIEIKIDDPPTAPVAIDQTFYEVTLMKGATTIEGPFVPTEPINPFLISTTLAPGSYTVNVRETYSGNVPGCVISQDVIIGADALPPVISLAGSIAANTACDVNQFDGQIDISVSKDPNDLAGAGVTYDILMSPDPNTAFPLNGQPIGNYPAADLGPGTYTFTVNASTGCTAVKSFTVLDNPTKSQLTAANITVTNAEYCDVTLEQSAAVLINQLNAIGGGPENISDYRFDWFTDATLSNSIYSGVGDPGATKGGEHLSNVGAPLPSSTVTNGAYWVVATKLNDLSGTGGIGCSSTPYNVNISNKKVLPQITLTPFGDGSCDPAVFEGSLRVDVTTATGPGIVGTYAYTWLPNGAAGQPINSAGNSGAANVYNNINDGTYQVTAVNEVTGCSNTLGTTIMKIAPPVFTVNALATELTNCATFDGRIDNLQVFVDGVGGNVGDFDYVWFKSNPMPASIVLDGKNAAVPVDTELTLATFPAIGLDKYFVKAIRKAGGEGIGCESAPLRKDILDARIYPQLDFATVSSTACDDNFDGRITVTANTASGPGAGAGYNFVWTDDPDGLVGTDFSASNSANNNTASPFATATTDLIGEGLYKIRVTNFTTQCFTDGSVSVARQSVPMEIVSVTPTHVDVCAPLVVNGSGTVTAVNVSGAPGNTGDFSYTWANNAGMTSPLVTNDPLLTQVGLDVGTYYVIARRDVVVSPATPGVTGSGCATSPVPFTVLDHRVTPTISFATVSSTACDDNFDGRIMVTANTASGPGAGMGYNFVWTDDPDGLVGT